MEKYIWTEKYSVHVKVIDEQHQHYLKIVDEIIKMTGQEKFSAADLSFKIDNLSNYAIYHFSTEESLFKYYSYPDTEEHIDAHDVYRGKIREFALEAGKEIADVKKIALEIAEFAGSWLLNHIMIMDQKYIDFMRQNNIN